MNGGTVGTTLLEPHRRSPCIIRTEMVLLRSDVWLTACLGTTELDCDVSGRRSNRGPSMLAYGDYLSEESERAGC